jgi:hypothetical protein
MTSCLSHFPCSRIDWCILRRNSPRNILDVRLHAIAPGPPLEEEFGISRLAEDKGHTEEVEGF